MASFTVMLMTLYSIMVFKKALSIAPKLSIYNLATHNNMKKDNPVRSLILLKTEAYQRISLKGEV